jgi:hypothetical protein
MSEMSKRQKDRRLRNPPTSATTEPTPGGQGPRTPVRVTATVRCGIVVGSTADDVHSGYGNWHRHRMDAHLDGPPDGRLAQRQINRT